MKKLLCRLEYILHYLLSVNTGSFTEHSQFIIIVHLELLNKQLILVLRRCSLKNRW
jgi:hypothetical protein